MKRHNRLPRPVRDARKMKTMVIELSRNADLKLRSLARNFGTSPEVVLGLLVTFELARCEQDASEDIGDLARRLGLSVAEC